METAVFEKLVGEFSLYGAKVCASNSNETITFTYGGCAEGYWGINNITTTGKINICDPGLTSQDNTNYIVFHEVAHVMTYYDDQWFDGFKQFQGTLSEKPYCFYDYDFESDINAEKFAESAAFYAFDPCGNFQQAYPASYKYMNEVLFK